MRFNEMRQIRANILNQPHFEDLTYFEEVLKRMRGRDRCELRYMFKYIRSRLSVVGDYPIISKILRISKDIVKPISRGALNRLFRRGLMEDEIENWTENVLRSICCSIPHLGNPRKQNLALENASSQGQGLDRDSKDPPSIQKNGTNGIELTLKDLENKFFEIPSKKEKARL